MSKRKIIVLTFVLLILLTIAASIANAIISYNKELSELTGDPDIDKWIGFGAFVALFIGGCLVFYELDLLCTVYCALVKPKPIIKTVLSVLANLCLTLILVILCYDTWHDPSAGPLFGSAEATVEKSALYMYLPLRFGFLIAAGLSNAKEEKLKEETK